MKKRNIYIIIIFLIIISLVIYFMYPKKEYQNNNANLGNMAIMLEDSADSNTYFESANREFPETGYSYNAEKSYCLNGSTLTWDNENKSISVTSNGNDKCYVYFDVYVRPTDNLTEYILVDNGGAAAIEAKGTPDFSKISPPVIDYTDTNFNEITSYASPTSTNYITYADSYTFNDQIGTYTLTNPQVCQFSSCYATLTNKYVVDFGSSSSEAASSTYLSRIYKIETATSTTLTIRESSKKQNQDMSDKGMYAAQDDYGTSYYFRGAVDNNWVKFAGMYWRIVRVNGDGTVKLIYSGTTAPTESEKVVMAGYGTKIGTSPFSGSNNDNMYVGYMYTSGEVHGTGTSSEIKTTIDNWYASKLASYSNYLADTIFCNDRSPSTSSDTLNGSGGTGTTWTIYGSWIRNLTNNAPILTCPNKSDAFTVSDTTKGNGALTYPVGLITADEAAMAGGVPFTTNSSNYLHTNNYYWTGSPSNFANSSVSVFVMYSDGYLGTNSVGNFNMYDVRPVVSLTSNTQVTGSGTWNDPYLVQ